MRALLLCLLGLTLQPAMADQYDPALPDLFTALKTAAPGQGAPLEAQIWAAWYRVPAGADQDAFDQARFWIGQRFFPIAIEALQGVTATHPTFAEAHNQLAIAYFATGQDGLSQAAVERVVALEPRHFGAWAGLAQIRLRQGDAAGAIDAAEIALALNPHLGGLQQLIEAAKAVIASQSV